jgi:hypothetical protein
MLIPNTRFPSISKKQYEKKEELNTDKLQKVMETLVVQDTKREPIFKERKTPPKSKTFKLT